MKYLFFDFYFLIEIRSTVSRWFTRVKIEVILTGNRLILHKRCTWIYCDGFIRSKAKIAYKCKTNRAWRLMIWSQGNIATEGSPTSELCRTFLVWFQWLFIVYVVPYAALHTTAWSTVYAQPRWQEIRLGLEPSTYEFRTTTAPNKPSETALIIRKLVNTVISVICILLCQKSSQAILKKNNEYNSWHMV